MASRRQWLLTGLQVGLSGGLVLLLVQVVDAGAAMRQALALAPSTAVAALALTFLAFGVNALRWLVLLRATEDVSLRRILPHYWVGAFFNNLLPSGVGGDAVRVLTIARSGLALRPAIVSSVLDRFVGLLALLVLGALCIPLIGQSAPVALAVPLGPAVWPAAAAAGLAALLIAFLFLRQRLARLWRFGQPYFRRFPLAIGCSLITNLSFIAAIGLIARDLGIPVSAGLLATIPVVMAVAALPLSVGGIGLREGGMVLLLQPQGVAPEAALALGILYSVLIWTGSLPGAVVAARLSVFARRPDGDGGASGSAGG